MAASASLARAERLSAVAYANTRRQGGLKRLCRDELVLFDDPLGLKLEQRALDRAERTRLLRGESRDPMRLTGEVDDFFRTFVKQVWPIIAEDRPSVFRVDDPLKVDIFQSSRPIADIGPEGQLTLSRTLVKGLLYPSDLILAILLAASRRVLLEAVRLPLAKDGTPILQKALLAAQLENKEPVPPEIVSFLMGRAARNDRFGGTSDRDRDLAAKAKIQRREELADERRRYVMHAARRAGFNPERLESVAELIAASPEEARLQMRRLRPTLDDLRFPSEHDGRRGIIGMAYLRAHLDERER